MYPLQCMPCPLYKCIHSHCTNTYTLDWLCLVAIWAVSHLASPCSWAGGEWWNWRHFLCTHSKAVSASMDPSLMYMNRIAHYSTTANYNCLWFFSNWVQSHIAMMSFQLTTKLNISSFQSPQVDRFPSTTTSTLFTPCYMIHCTLYHPFFPCFSCLHYTVSLSLQ